MATGNQYNLNNTNGQLYFSIVENPVVEPLDGPLFVEHLMMRFPEETYSKSRDSHLYKFLTALVGDSGSGVLKKKSLFARLQFEAALLSFNDLDKLYSPMIGFGRLPNEKYSINPKSSTLTSEEWDAIKAADMSYRHRAMNYLQAARKGGTVEGITAAASAAIGKPVQVVENYRYVFDQISDAKVGHERVGTTLSTSEFIIRPTVEASETNDDIYATLFVSQSAIGDFRFVYEGGYTDYIYMSNVSQDIIAHTLMGIDLFSTGEVLVTKTTSSTYEIRFITPRALVQRLSVESDNVSDSDLYVVQSSENNTFYTTSFGDPSQDYYNAVINGDSIVDIPQRSSSTSYLDPSVQKNLDIVVNRIKPSSSIYSIAPSQQRHLPVNINSVFASSERFVVNRFVSSSINYGSTDLLSGRFVKVGSEQEERNYAFAGMDLPVVFYTVDSVISYGQAALFDSAYPTNEFYDGPDAVYKTYESFRIGKYFSPAPSIYPFLSNVSTDMMFVTNNILPSNDTHAIFRGAPTV